MEVHTFSDIGKYTIFPQEHIKKMFPRKVFGTIEEDDYVKNETYGIMCREEGLRLTNEFHRLTVPSERSIPYGELAVWSNSQVKEKILLDDVNYVGLQ